MGSGWSSEESHKAKKAFRDRQDELMTIPFTYVNPKNDPEVKKFALAVIAIAMKMGISLTPKDLALEKEAKEIWFAEKVKNETTGETTSFMDDIAKRGNAELRANLTSLNDWRALLSSTKDMSKLTEAIATVATTRVIISPPSP